jgi:hypothetical protein
MLLPVVVVADTLGQLTLPFFSWGDFFCLKKNLTTCEIGVLFAHPVRFLPRSILLSDSLFLANINVFRIRLRFFSPAVAVDVNRAKTRQRSA